MNAMRQEWVSVTLAVLFAIYFIFVIKAPVNRKNHRIGHLMLLPAIIVVMLSLNYIDGGKMRELLKKDSFLSQQYSLYNQRLYGDYGLLWQKEISQDTDIRNVLDMKAERELIIQDMTSNLTEIESEHEKQIPSVPQQLELERLRHVFNIFALDREQAEKVEDLMNYLKTLELGQITLEQQIEIDARKKEIDKYSDRITEAQFKLNNANLAY